LGPKNAQRSFVYDARTGRLEASEVVLASHILYPIADAVPVSPRERVLHLPATSPPQPTTLRPPLVTSHCSRRHVGGRSPQPWGAAIILPGGEVGILRSWWNAADGSEWRWQVEFYNHR